MKNLTKFIVLTMMIAVPWQVSAQTDPVGEVVEKSAEALEMDHDHAVLAEAFEDLAENPVRLNMAGEAEINTIPFLSPKQRKALLDYLSTYGEVLSVYELQSIPGFDSVLIKKIAPFISLKPPSHSPRFTPANLISYGHHQLLVRYEQSFPESAGYLKPDSVPDSGKNNYYKGSPQKYYFRYLYTWSDRIRIGLSGEKDPGEQFFRGAQKYGMDFYSGYLCIGNTGPLKNLILGNFRASFGQGLTFGSGFSPGSLPGFVMTAGQAPGIRPALGVSEGSYLRGLAATLKIKPVEISGFISYHPCDATLAEGDTAEKADKTVSSFVTTGYHRTEAEIAKRNAVKELLCGGNVALCLAPTQRLGFRIGITGCYVRYSSPLVPKIYPYNRFTFTGRENYDLGLDYQVRLPATWFFGEVSRSRNGGMAWLAGAVANPDPSVTITAIYRDYQSAYQNLYSSAFGQNSRNAGERGIYAAINAALHSKLSLSAFADLFAFTWLKYRVDRPTRGQEFGSLLSWQATPRVAVGFRFSRKNTQMNGSSGQEVILHKLTPHTVLSYRFTIDWNPGMDLSLKTRIEIKKARDSGLDIGPGYFVSQDVKVSPLKWPASFTFRFALFDIPDYDVRIYTYEPEVLYGYSVPAFQGRGMRSCLVMKFRIGRKIDFWLRGGLTYYTDRDEVGTGADMTKGNMRSEVTGQVMFRL